MGGIKLVANVWSNLRDFPRNSAFFGSLMVSRVFQIFFTISWIYPRTKDAMVTTRIIAFVVGKSYKLAFTTVACSRGWSSTHDHSRGLQTHYKDFEGSMTMSLHSHFWPCHSGGVYFFPQCKLTTNVGRFSMGYDFFKKYTGCIAQYFFHTVDGQIPAPVWYHYLQGFIQGRWLFGISEPSTVLCK